VDKPAGMLTIPDRFDASQPNLVAYLQKSHGTIIPVHRLDRYTSGVHIFAKNAETHKEISLMFQSREVEKYYMTLVDGVPKPSSGRIDVPLTESTTTRGKMLVHSRGKESVTDYKVLESYGLFSWLYVRIHTGRMHQVRVHMQYLGTPLIVDTLYGLREHFYLSEIKGKKMKLGKAEEEKPLLSRQPLHAEKLVFRHPSTGENLSITAPLPKDMRAVIQQMQKWLPVQKYTE
jgi:RluA family pseudouridine synthase